MNLSALVNELEAVGLLAGEDRARLLAGVESLGRDDLARIEAALVEAVEPLLDKPDDEATEEDLASLEASAQLLEHVRAELDRRPTPQAARAALLARIRNQPPAQPRRPATPAGRPPGMTRGPSRGPDATRVVDARGRTLTGRTALADALSEAGHDLAVSGAPGGFRWRVASVQADFPEDRRLGSDPFVNSERIAAVTSLDAITASGGACAPVAARYELTVVGTDARPVRDGALARFGADRGGITFMPAPTLADVATGVGIWTAANDLSPSDPATKPCVTLACPEPTEVLVEAVTRCAEFGNFRSRYFPEQVVAALQVLGAQHARTAELELITAMEAASTQTTTGQLLGATRDVLAGLDRAGAGLRARHRMSLNQPLRLVAPAWLRDAIRTDLARELPGSTAERLATADREIAAFFAARAVNVTWSLDYGAASFDHQGDGPLIGWPSMVSTLLYPEGCWLFLDGGALDLGIVRDSTLNATNDMQVFAETFENVAQVGVESLRVTFDICPDGSTSGSADISPCDTGS